MDFALPADHSVKLKENEKKDKCLNFVMELKNLGKLKITVVPIVIGTLAWVTKELIQGLEDLEIRTRVDTIQTKTFMRSATIRRRVLETWGDLLSLKLKWETIS